MNLVIHGLDKGAKPARFVEHLYRLEGDTLEHFTDGQLRAQVPPEGLVDFAIDHPDVASLIEPADRSSFEAAVADRTRARAAELAAIAQKVSAGADQNAISKIVEREVAKALAQYQAAQAAALAAAKPAQQ